jgi:hypothetical protein
MPRLARRANSDRLMAEMSSVARALLQETRATCGLGEHWQEAEDLQVLITHITVLQYAGRLKDGGIADDAALEEAAAYFGVSADTVRTRQRRWYRDTRRKTDIHVEPAEPSDRCASSGSTTTHHTQTKVRGAPK